MAQTGTSVGKWQGKPVKIPKLSHRLFDSNKYPVINGPLDEVASQKQITKHRTKQRTKPNKSQCIMSFFETLEVESQIYEDNNKHQDNYQAYMNQTCIKYFLENKLQFYANCVRIRDNDSEFVQKLKEEFTCKPYKKPTSKYKVKSFHLYTEGHEGTERADTYLYFPKVPFIEAFGSILNKTNAIQFNFNASLNLMNQDSSNLYKFNGTLRDYQQPLMDHVLSCLMNRLSHSGLINGDPSCGKTCMSLYLISQLKLPALVLAPNTKLFDQWIEAAQRWIPNAIIGKYKAKKRPPSNCTICIGSLQTIMRKNVNEKSLRRFKVLIIDETHHICAASFNKCLQAVNPIFTVGVTATLDRVDKLSAWIEALVGPLLYQLKAKIDADFQVLEYKHKTWTNPIQRWNNQLDYVSAVTKLCNLAHRTRTIAKVIRNIVQDKNRFLICIGSRQKICLTLYYILKRCGSDIGIMTTTLTTPNAKRCQILVGTDKMIGEGFNDTKRNCVVLLTSYKGPEKSKESNSGYYGGSMLIQIIGRCCRQSTQCKPLIVDVIDKGTCFESSFYTRAKHYKTKQFTRLKNIVVNEM